MAAQQFSIPFSPAFSSNGLPIAGAQLRFRLSGTTTLTPVYTDAALTVALTNPVVSNAAGRFPDIYLDEDIDYRVDILDADGAEIDSTDPFIPGAGTSSGAIGVDVTRYGAIGDDSTNNAVAIVAAIAAAKAVDLPLYFPAGTYRFGSTINFEQVSVVGDGSFATILKPMHAGVGVQLGRPVPPDFVDTIRHSFRGFTILANTSTTKAFYLFRCHFCEFSDITVLHPSGVGSSYRGWRVTGAMYYNTFINCFSDSTTETESSFGIGWHIGNGENEIMQANAAVNANVWINCRANKIPVGFDIERAQGCSFFGGGVEACATAGMKMRGSGNYVANMWFEDAKFRTDNYTPGDGSGGVGAAERPERNVFIGAPVNTVVEVYNSVGIDLIGTFGNVTLDSTAYNTSVTGRINGTLADTSNDSVVRAVVSGAQTEIVRSGTTVAYQRSNDSSATKILAPSATTVGAAGGASALPATPTGYYTVNINGTDRKVPYYAVA